MLLFTLEGKKRRGHSIYAAALTCHLSHSYFHVTCVSQRFGLGLAGWAIRTLGKKTLFLQESVLFAFTSIHQLCSLFLTLGVRSVVHFSQSLGYLNEKVTQTNGSTE